MYEEQISDSKTQISLLPVITKTIRETAVFSDEKYDVLSSKCLVYSNKLLKKPDQVRAICNASHLFSHGKYICYKDGKKILECLQKALKIADTCMDAITNIQLFIEILNYYIYFYKRGIPSISQTYLDSLVDLIQTNLNNLEYQDSYEPVSKYFRNTVQYFQSNSSVLPTIQESFARGISLTQKPAPVIEEEKFAAETSPASSTTPEFYPSSPQYEISEDQPW